MFTTRRNACQWNDFEDSRTGLLHKGMDAPEKIEGDGIHTTDSQASSGKRIHFIVTGKRGIYSMVNKHIYENSII